jgi:hypothetical protein
MIRLVGMISSPDKKAGRAVGGRQPGRSCAQNTDFTLLVLYF